MDDFLVSVSGLAKDFGRRTVVREVTFDLAPGQIIGLVGANGGGKTTTLRMVAGLMRPDAGSGRTLGHDIARMSVPVRRDISYVSQKPCLYGELSVLENLRFHARMQGMTDLDDHVVVKAAQYGIEGVLKKPVGQLSGGWARRVQFVACTLHRPRLLLLDEPTAGLDALTRRDMWRWLAEFASQGCGVIISTHDLAEVETCDRILPYHAGLAFPLQTPASFIAEHGGERLEDAMLAFVAENH